MSDLQQRPPIRGSRRRRVSPLLLPVLPWVTSTDSTNLQILARYFENLSFLRRRSDCRTGWEMAIVRQPTWNRSATTVSSWYGGLAQRRDRKGKSESTRSRCSHYRLGRRRSTPHSQSTASARRLKTDVESVDRSAEEVRNDRSDALRQRGRAGRRRSLQRSSCAPRRSSTTSSGAEVYSSSLRRSVRRCESSVCSGVNGECGGEEGVGRGGEQSGEEAEGVLIGLEESFFSCNCIFTPSFASSYLLVLTARLHRLESVAVRIASSFAKIGIVAGIALANEQGSTPCTVTERHACSKAARTKLEPQIRVQPDFFATFFPPYPRCGEHSTHYDGAVRGVNGEKFNFSRARIFFILLVSFLLHFKSTLPPLLFSRWLPHLLSSRRPGKPPPNSEVSPQNGYSRARFWRSGRLLGLRDCAGRRRSGWWSRRVVSSSRTA